MAVGGGGDVIGARTVCLKNEVYHGENVQMSDERMKGW